MTNDGIGVILIFLQEVVGSRKRNLIDVFVYFFCCQADTMIGYGNRILTQRHVHSQITGFTLKLTDRSQCFKLLRSIDGIRN